MYRFKQSDEWKGGEKYVGCNMGVDTSLDVII